MTSAESTAPERLNVRGRSRGWLRCALLGFLTVMAVLIVVTLVVADKTNFGWLVGPMFLPVVTIAVVTGAVALFLGAWNAAARRDWRRTALLVWAVVAAVSPAFGLMILLPWGLLALSLPVVMPALFSLWRESR